MSPRRIRRPKKKKKPHTASSPHPAPVNTAVGSVRIARGTAVRRPRYPSGIWKSVRTVMLSVLVPCVRCAVQPRTVPAAAAAGVCRCRRRLSPGYACTGRPAVLYYSRRVLSSPEQRKLWTRARFSHTAAPRLLKSGGSRVRSTRPEHPAPGAADGRTEII